MSETHNPNEPLIIKSDRPHEVTMPEGTNVAVGKKGEEGTPAVRKVLADPDEHAVEHMVMDGGVSKSSTHADILVGAKRVIIFTLMNLTAEEVAQLPKGPFGLAEKTHPGNAHAEAAMIEAAGGKAFVVAGNPPAGTNFMDATLLKDAMSRGAAQALVDLPAVKAVWND